MTPHKQADDLLHPPYPYNPITPPKVSRHIAKTLEETSKWDPAYFAPVDKEKEVDAEEECVWQEQGEEDAGKDCDMMADGNDEDEDYSETDQSEEEYEKPGPAPAPLIKLEQAQSELRRARRKGIYSPAIIRQMESEVRTLTKEVRDGPREDLKRVEETIARQQTILLEKVASKEERIARAKAAQTRMAEEMDDQKQQLYQQYLDQVQTLEEQTAAKKQKLQIQHRPAEGEHYHGTGPTRRGHERIEIQSRRYQDSGNQNERHRADNPRGEGGEWNLVWRNGKPTAAATMRERTQPGVTNPWTTPPRDANCNKSGYAGRNNISGPRAKTSRVTEITSPSDNSTFPINGTALFHRQ